MARVQRELADVHVPFKVAVMGCVVNGPGEAREADIGICGGGHGTGLLIKKGEAPRKVTGDLAQTLVAVSYTHLDVYKRQGYVPVRA